MVLQLSKKSAGQTGASDFSFVVDRQDNGNATITLKYKGQTATDTNGNAITQTTAAWDDAIPWSSGTYSTTYNNNYLGEPSWRIPDGSIPGRNGILLHLGNQTTKSQVLEGCVGASANFLEAANAAIKAKGQLNLVTPMVVNGSFPVTVTTTVDTTSIDEGGSAVFTISLGGAGGTNGVSKDIWFRLNITDKPSSANIAAYGTDFTIEATDPSSGPHEVAVFKPAGDGWAAGYYVRLPKGMPSRSFTIHANDVQDDSGAAEPVETVDITVNDYFVVRQSGTKPAKEYSDDLTQPGVLLNGAKLAPAISITEPGVLTKVSLDGGIEGLKRTFSVHQGDLITFFFDAYTIPDSLDISDGTQDVGTGGFVSDQHSGQLTAASNKISVIVIGSTSGTAWHLDLTDATNHGSSPSAPAQSAPLLASEPPADSVVAQPAAGSSAAAAAAATLSLISSTAVTVPTTGTTTANLTVAAGKEYFIRVVGSELTQKTTDLADGYLKIFDTNATTPLIESHTSSILGEPAAFFDTTAAGTVSAVVGSDLAGQGGSAKVELYDAGALTAPLLYVEADGTSRAAKGTDDEIDVRVHRAGDVSQAATYTLRLSGSGTNPISGGDIVGGATTWSVSFAAGEYIQSVAITPVDDGKVDGEKLGTIALDAGAQNAEVSANDAVLGVSASATIAIEDAPDTSIGTAPVVAAADATAAARTGTLTFTVSLTSVSSFPISVSYVTVDDSAKAGIDYQTTSGEITFAPGATAAQVTVKLLAVPGVQANRDFHLNLVDAFGADLQGGGTVQTATGTITHNIAAAPPFSDFNGDLKSDLLWRDNLGNFALWEMNGGQVLSGLSVSNPGASLNVLDILGPTGGSDKSDILWADPANNLALWQMSGSTVVNAGALPNPGTFSTYLGSGDFNGDGKADILWGDDAGNITMWQMNGTQVAKSTVLPNVGSAIKVVGVGDFDGDGKADILFRGPGGTNALWEMNGDQIHATLFIPDPGDALHVLDTGDYNGDGKADILWRDDPGNFALWEMDGAKVLAGLAVPNPGGALQVVGARSDYNGDGRSDLFWRDPAGNTALWEMNGGTVTAALSVPNPGSSFTIPFHHF